MTDALTTSQQLPSDEQFEEEAILEVADLAVSFVSADGRRTQAVDGVQLSIFPRQTLAVVGESGCGKSVTALSTLQLIPSPPGRLDRGSIFFDGRDLLSLQPREMRAIRGAQIAMIFQEPMTSLNPVFTIGNQIVEAIRLHRDVTHQQARELAAKALTDVGISDAKRRLKQYPHEFSGGMRQRVMIAMALACEPRLLLADEPTTALDVTIQKQILALLDDLRQSRAMALMLITHNLGVVAQHADVVCVMYQGRVVEYATVHELFANPLHPYTRGLLASIPRLDVHADRLTTMRDLVSDPEQFQRLTDGVIPWWPEHEAPDHMATSPGPPCVLHEYENDHWIGVWRTQSVAQRRDRRPSLRFRRQLAKNAPKATA